MTNVAVQSLNCCRLCGAPALEQVRGELRGGDKGWVESKGPDGQLLHPEVQGSNVPANASNTRVICSGRDCDNSTGWMAGEMADYMRFCWNRDNPPASASPPPLPDHIVERALNNAMPV